MMASRRLSFKKPGFTLAELLIAIVLLSVIMAAISAIFSVAIRNYQVSFAQSGIQKDLNLVVDGISREVKQSIEIPESHLTFERSATLLILALPAINEEDEFIYNGEEIEKDYLIYQLDQNRLKKITLANPESRRHLTDQSEKIILTDVSDLSFVYTPTFETTKVETSITVSRFISKTNLVIDAKNTANRRNYE